MALHSDELFELIKAKVDARTDPAPSAVAGVFVHNILKDGKQVKQWTVDLKSPKRSVYQGAPPAGVEVTATVTVEDDLWTKIQKKNLDTDDPALRAQVKVEGNKEMFKAFAKLGKDF